MLGTAASAVFILGDLFEAWVGDDAARQPGLEAQCAATLRAAAARRPVHFMRGNRDFLVGPAFLAACGVQDLPDDDRSEERRVGKECRSRWSPYH